MFVLDFLNFFFGLILIFFTIILFHPINRYKKVKTKEEQLFIQKTLITTLYFISILIINILFILSIMNDTDLLYLIEVFSFNAYIIIIVLYNFFMSIELHSTYMNPIHFFNRLLKQYRYNYIQEFIILLIGIIIPIVDFILYNKDKYDIKDNIKNKDSDDDEKDYFCNDSSIFILISVWKSIVIILISFISIIFCLRIKSKISKFAFKDQEKLYNKISKRNLSNFLFLLYGLFYGLPFFIGLDFTEFYNGFGSLFFLIVLFNDLAIDISVLSTTKFCEYRLKNTLLGYFCSFFTKPSFKYNTSANAPLVNEASINEVTEMTTFQNDTSTALEIITNNPKDKELVSTYKNGIFIEDYFFGYFDQILNIITSSLFYVYNSNHFSSQANEKRLSNNIQIGGDISGIGGPMQNLTMSNLGNNKTVLGSKNDVGDDITTFNIIKNMGKDDLHRFKDVLENGININNNNNYLNLNIKSFFTPRCLECIYDQKLRGKHIGNSVLSHMILTNNNKNIDNPNSYFWSLFASNAKEELFNNLRNTSIKTYDKKFTLDIFDSDDTDINLGARGKNGDLATLLNQYFIYLHSRGINGTFIPSLIGVFKIKINNFKTLLVLVTRNSLVENVPQNFFTYWQLIKFLNDKPQKVSSSQVISGGTLVKDDPIFERSFQIETKKDNPNYNKIFVKNYVDFEITIKNDIQFLKQIGVQNFFLLLMYYEYENTQKHEKQGAIKIRHTNKGAEFIEESLPKGSLFDEEENMGTPISKFGSKIESFGGGFLSPVGNFLDDNEIGGGKNIKNMGNMIDYEEKVNINGYEGVFDSFNCMCFFTFENVFDLRKRFSLSFNYYNNFQNKILVHFTNYKNNNSK